MLRVRSTELPTQGWGRLDVTEADISFDEPGEPKTGPRSVPIPRVLVAILREWCDTNHLSTPDRLLSVDAIQKPTSRYQFCAYLRFQRSQPCDGRGILR
jgi:hypothetical protein